jgi:hypothetical protein
LALKPRFWWQKGAFKRGKHIREKMKGQLSIFHFYTKQDLMSQLAARPAQNTPVSLVLGKKGEKEKMNIMTMTAMMVILSFSASFGDMNYDCPKGKAGRRVPGPVYEIQWN